MEGTESRGRPPVQAGVGHSTGDVVTVDPRTDEVIILGSGLLTQDVILERVHVLTTFDPGERYAGEQYLRDHGGYALERLPTGGSAPARQPEPEPDAPRLVQTFGGQP